MEFVEHEYPQCLAGTCPHCNREYRRRSQRNRAMALILDQRDRALADLARMRADRDALLKDKAALVLARGEA